MGHIVLVGCSRVKRSTAARARDLYESERFHLAMRFADERADRWWILSARHGLLDPDSTIAPYDEDLEMRQDFEQQRWAESILDQVRPELRPNDIVTILADGAYASLGTYLANAVDVKVFTPLVGLQQRAKIRWIKGALGLTGRARCLERFYSQLARLEKAVGGRRALADCSGEMDWPPRGVYFFFERGQTRQDHTTSRVVRVGTHAVSRGSDSTLWQRLKTHRGTDDGLGNHRSSIFRLHVGTALAARDPAKWQISSWGTAASADEVRNEAALEREVSDVLGRMDLLWIGVNDEPGPASDRAFVERYAIALLAGAEGPIDVASRDWLGNYCANPGVARSSLWNVDHVGRQFDERFIATFDQLVDMAERGEQASLKSLAPPQWHGRASKALGQKTLFGDES